MYLLPDDYGLIGASLCFEIVPFNIGVTASYDGLHFFQGLFAAKGFNVSRHQLFNAQVFSRRVRGENGKAKGDKVVLDVVLRRERGPFFTLEQVSVELTLP